MARPDLAARAQAVKVASLGVQAVGGILRLRCNFEARRLTCPACGAYGAKVSEADDTWACVPWPGVDVYGQPCGATGDVISLVRSVLGVGFAEACAWLELNAQRSVRAANEGDLFGA